MSERMVGSSHYFQQGYDKGYEDAITDLEKAIKENGILASSITLISIINKLKPANERKE